ncbi:MAG: NTP transferase domain-containing protein [Nocardioidaceae bacterium]|nr:NTP transferase domain-containing protein [Nocardioidaceae bacterium]MCL2615096.1 NTP transferase domain-containing protein [Nocardioidaceae bacterium]
MQPGDLSSFAAVVLAGGRAIRLGGFDKATIEVDGRLLLDYALDAVMDAAEVVVVGRQAPTERPVTFVREDPRYGGPVAGLLTGRDHLLRTVPTVAVLAVDMPRLTFSTFRRLHEAAEGHDGAILVGPDGRRQLAFVVRLERLDAVDPGPEGRHDAALHRLLAPLDLAEVPAIGSEWRDVDSWADLRDLAGDRPDPLA